MTAQPAVGITVRLPSMLAELADGSRTLTITAAPSTVRALLDAVAGTHPALERRIRDEQGQVRRYVNVYVDGVDVRHADGQDTALADGAEIHVLPSVAGGCAEHD